MTWASGPPADEVGDPVPHVVLGEHDMVSAHPLEDPAMRLRHRLGPDVGNPEVIQGRSGEDTGLDVRSDGDDGIAEVGDTELAERLLTGRVGLHDMGEQVGVVLDPATVVVDAQHLEAEPHEFGPDGSPEPAQADDDDLLPGFRRTAVPPAASRSLISQ